MYNSVPGVGSPFIGRPVRECIIMALVALLVSGCGSCLGKRPAEPGGPRVQTPAAPLSTPQAQTPGSPASAPVPASSAGGDDGAYAEAEGTPETPEPLRPFSAELLLNVKPGMSYEEVRQALGDPGMIIAGNDAQNSVYRWSASGMSFMGRFENGKLIRKSIISPEYGTRTLDDDTMQFDQDLFARVVPGMSFEEVLSIIGMDAEPLSSGNNNVKLYKWTDSNGSSITARFENQVLVRKSGMIVAADKGDTSQNEGNADVAAEEEDSRASDEAREEESMRDIPETEPEPAPQQITPGAVAQRPRVHVVGAKRREREIANDPSPYAGRSYRPEVKLPEFNRKLRPGSYEIHIHNTTESRVRVAIVSEEGGLEVSIGPNAHEETRVGRGTYQFYFIYDDSPYTLHQGQRIPVKELLTDFIVYLFDDSSTVDLL